jgi:hypothetical protein
MKFDVPQALSTASLDPELAVLADAVGHALDGVTRIRSDATNSMESGTTRAT